MLFFFFFFFQAEDGIRDDLVTGVQTCALPIVGRTGGAADRGAVGTARVAALPLVGVGDRLRPAPAARGRRQRLPVLRRAGDRRGRGVDRRRRRPLYDRRRGRGGAGRAGGVAGRHDDAQPAADVGTRHRVGRTGGAADRGAVGTARVAALPLVGVGDRLRPAPAARGRRQRLPVLRRPGDRRRRGVDRRRGRPRG